MNHKIKSKTFFILFSFVIFFFSGDLFAYSYQAIVPLNITVQGKLVITDGENDTKSSLNPTTNVLLRITPDLSNSIVSGTSSVRIRANLSSWKLIAQRKDISNQETNIDLHDIALSLKTEAGTSANTNCAKLLPPFDSTTNITQISATGPTEILSGNNKTSTARDTENKNNWFQLTSTYSILPDFFYSPGEWNTVISYNLVSP